MQTDNFYGLSRRELASMAKGNAKFFTPAQSSNNHVTISGKAITSPKKITWMMM